MPASSNDDPQLPKLRRFRFDSEDDEVPREIPAVPPSSPVTDSAARSHSDDDLVDPDRLLGAADVASPRSYPAAPSPSTRREERSPSTTPPAAAPPPVGAPDRRFDQGAPTPGASHAGTQRGAAPSSPPSSSGGRPRTPLLIAGVVALAVIAAVVWLVVRPGSDESKDPEAQREQKSEVSTSQWAEGVCSRLTTFQTDVMPVKAAAAKAADGSPAEEEVTELRRQAGVLLSALAADLQQVDVPDDRPLETVQNTLVSSVTQAAESAQATGNGAIGSPAEMASEIATALDRPKVTFAEQVSSLDEAKRDELGSVGQCQGLL